MITAFEDVPKLLAAEAALPPNADPLLADLAKPDERARLARLLLQGLDRPAGFVLPLRAPAARGRTRGRPGAAVPGRCGASASTLLPGDSPLGLRLPLASLPDVLPKTRSRNFRSIRSRRATRCPATATLAKREARNAAAKPAAGRRGT